jgi:hypothetical protein
MIVPKKKVQEATFVRTRSSEINRAILGAFSEIAKNPSNMEEELRILGRMLGEGIFHALPLLKPVTVGEENRIGELIIKALTAEIRF